MHSSCWAGCKVDPAGCPCNLLSSATAPSGSSFWVGHFAWRLPSFNLQGGSAPGPSWAKSNPMHPLHQQGSSRSRIGKACNPGSTCNEQRACLVNRVGGPAHLGPRRSAIPSQLQSRKFLVPQVCQFQVVQALERQR